MKTVSLCLLLFIATTGYAKDRSIACAGIAYDGKVSITTRQPSIFIKYGIEADLYMVLTKANGMVYYLDYRQININETSTSIELTYAMSAKSSTANRVLKINKANGAGEFFNKLTDSSSLLVSSTLSCQVQ